jgi:hypothetical protein
MRQTNGLGCVILQHYFSFLSNKICIILKEALMGFQEKSLVVHGTILIEMVSKVQVTCCQSVQSTVFFFSFGLSSFYSAMFFASALYAD